MTLGSVTSTGGAPSSGGIDPTPSEPSTDRAASGFELLLAGARSETGAVVRDDRRGPEQSGAEPEPTARRESDSRDARETGGPNARGNDATETENKPSATTDAPANAPEPQPPAKPVPAADLAALLAALGALAGAPQPTTTAAVTAPAPADSGPDSPPVTDPGALPVPTTVVDLAVAALSLSGAPGATPAGTTPAAPAPTPDPTLSGPAGPAAGNGPVPRLDHASTATTSSVTNGTANATSTPPAVDSAGPPPSDRPRPPIPLAAAASGAATFAAAPAPTVTASTDDATATVVAVAPPPPPAEQLVSVLTPLRTTSNGSYTLRLELKPPELGRVEMRVEMRDGVLHASIHADHEGSAQLVRDALNELRDRLDAEGVRTGELTVSDGGVGSGSQGNRDASASASASSVTAITPTDEPGAVAAIPPALPSDTTSLLDVRV